MPDEDLETAYTVAQTARMLGYSYEHMRRMIKRGDIVGCIQPVGRGRIMVPRRAIDEFVARNAIKSVSLPPVQRRSA